MSVYDLANKLATGLTKSDEYKRYQEAVVKVKGNEKNEQILSDLRSKQMEIQNMQMMGQSVPLEKIQDLENLSQKLVDYDEVAEFLEAEFYFGQMIGDIQSTITQAVEFWTPPEK
ncbi:Cell fate regulator YlbF, YheA/YmcA/DUF963 family (controls sporulation, competence, biofilm development) [Desulfonispora thiosulfatigenes DSM 11270]|uniref:Cell fate regulator YlbF, YheA/YmcA/DUF963 family (Controls sporulation, competence, biofilm development) n=1 Tax=Desulfonispora thiosulfatigenes DSM 11270 TaxID=656914 RepID=A0A1W1VSW1_DESTI|nr:YlbF family regulator [Desulfonispora thiosulfatigenes]SMB96457.1 Cell fate regulator YlbF, YheA/YmcA/DUF963 family (controls sporulation, competence, biofilm development) [Desulfonispora thiosulfatigenes DSM 11270]